MTSFSDAHIHLIHFKITVTCMSDSLWSFGLDIGFTDHLTDHNYNFLMELHTSNITIPTAHIKSSLSALDISW
jgi:hypothetical protein